MSRRKLKLALGALVLAGNALTLHAQMAQDPLLSRTAAVEPNIVFIFDDSGSMNSTAMYQYGGGTGYQGQRGPGNDTECVSGSTCIWVQPPGTLAKNAFYGRSPDVNTIYYDPRVTYKRRVNADGTLMAAGATGSISSFDVYFYRPDTGNQYSVPSVTVTNKGRGYPATGITATFTAPPTGGTRATANVVLEASGAVGAVNIVSGGQTWPLATSITVSFGPPPAGGVRATGTAVVSNTNNLATVTLNNALLFPNAACTAVVSAPQIAGVRAVVTPIREAGGGNRPIASFTVNNRGSGYTSAPTVNVTCGAVTQTFNTTQNLSATRVITAINITDPGAGYTSPPTVTATGGSGSGFVGDVATPLATSYRISAINVTNAGSGYLSPPTLTLANFAPGTGHSFTVNAVQSPAPTVNAKWDGTGTPTTAASYFTAGGKYIPDGASPLAPTAAVDGSGISLYAYPNTASSAQANYPKFRNRADCITAPTHCTWAEERQNYANWKAYHSTRLDLAKTGIGHAFQPLNPKFRLGWGTINSINNTDTLAAGVKLFDAPVQSSFLTWLYGRTAGVTNPTPNRSSLKKVGDYFTRADDNGPWGTTPNGSTSLTGAGSNPNHAACRRSYAMLMTDGYYNESFTIEDWDTRSTPITVTSSPSTYTYTRIGPYSDSSSTPVANTFADVAMKYYLSDLRPDVPNNVRAVPGDEAFWQHLNFYAIGLGVVGTLDSTDPAVLRSLTGNTPARTRSWPTPAASDPRAIDDMWHATVNARGKLLNAKTSDDLNDAITKMMSDISGKEGTQSGVAVSTASLTKDTKKYTPSYTPVSWTGNVTAYTLDPTNANQTGIAWEVEKLVSTDSATGVKTYESLIPAHNVRNIHVGNGATTGATRAVPFTYSAMGATLRAQMTGTVTTELIDYLRGDATNEDTSSSSSSTTAIYRARATRLGDIVNSTPVYVKDSVDLKYGDLTKPMSPVAAIPALMTTAAGAYAQHMADKKNRTEGVIFVGANDGMLHAFRDGTYNSNGGVITPGGAEVFAYVPNAVLPGISQLADKTYVHRYFVDGPNTETDAYHPTRNKWLNIVLGSTGAGAGALASPGTSPKTGIYAIDVTNLNAGPTGLTSSDVLWEVNSGIGTFTELGYVLTDIQAGVTKQGTWVAIFGNGYDSRSCQARLFVVNLFDGSLVREINTGSGNCLTAKNGLGGVRLVKDAGQRVIGAYAGDLQGNMWKFNLNSTSSAAWGVDHGGSPLFRSPVGPLQPITAPPSALKMPFAGAANPATGYMVLFGTGKFYEVADITSVNPQTMYGIWDPAEFGAGSAALSVIDTTRLVAQTVTGTVTGTNGNTYFTISSNPATYTGGTPHRGWHLALPVTGQRMVYPLDLLADRFAVVDTISPANVSLDPCANETGGVGFLYLIDALNGGGPTEQVLDTNGDNVVDENDLVVSGLESKADGRNVTLEVEKNDLEIKSANVSGGDPGATLLKISCRLTGTCKGPAGSLRRQWRQLFLR